MSQSCRRGLAAVFWAILAVTFAPPVDGSVRAVELGQVSASAKGADSAVIGELRSAVAEALDTVELRSAPDRFLFSAVLTRLDVESSDGRARVHCAITATLRSRRAGVLVAIFSGRAQVEDDETAVNIARRDALAVTARGVVRRIPEAIR